MPRSLSLLALWLLAAGVVLGLDGWQRLQHGALQTAPLAQWSAPQQAAQPLALVARGSIPMPANTPAAHASSLLAMPSPSPARLLAFWFAGSRESAPDVQIAASWQGRDDGQWRPARFVVNREQLGHELGFAVRRLGNPVAWLDAQQRVHLFVVATGLGGWAAGRIVHLRQVPGTGVDDMRFEPLRVLPLSWLWDTSHLVRTTPLALADGGMLLPLYFELGVKYPLAARFAANGDFVGMQRLSAHAGWLQPSMVMLNTTHWIALMRDFGPDHKIGAAESLDAGQHWSDLPPLALDNPDASIAAMGLQPGWMVMAYNPTAAGRNSLVLGQSNNGRDWTTATVLARADGDAEFSYPAMVWADGSLWISFTDQRQRIGWVQLHPTVPPAPAQPAAHEAPTRARGQR